MLNSTPSECLIHGQGSGDAEIEIGRTWAIVEDCPERVERCYIGLMLGSSRLSIASRTFKVRVVEHFIERVRWPIHSKVLEERE
jgi:hypothetical protein